MKKVAFLLCVLLLMSASCQQAEERLTDEQVEALREEYPTITVLGSRMNLDDIFSKEAGTCLENAILQVEVVTPDEIDTGNMAVDKEETFFSNITTYYYRVKINDIIAVNHNDFTYGDKVGLNIKEDLDLSFAYKEIYVCFPGFGAPSLKIGDKFVIIGEYAGERDEIPLLSTGSILAFYLTEDMYIMSMSEMPSENRYSGMTYKSFKKRCEEFAQEFKWDTKEGVE